MQAFAVGLLFSIVFFFFSSLLAFPLGIVHSPPLPLPPLPLAPLFVSTSTRSSFPLSLFFCSSLFSSAALLSTIPASSLRSPSFSAALFFSCLSSSLHRRACLCDVPASLWLVLFWDFLYYIVRTCSPIQTSSSLSL